MTWAGKQSEQPRSFQSPERYLLLTFPFIERAYRRSWSRYPSYRLAYRDLAADDNCLRRLARVTTSTDLLMNLQYKPNKQFRNHEVTSGAR
jgi:hypothetical protein